MELLTIEVFEMVLRVVEMVERLLLRAVVERVARLVDVLEDTKGDEVVLTPEEVVLVEATVLAVDESFDWLVVADVRAEEVLVVETNEDDRLLVGRVD
jgi:hypothetical protein